jgi:hypothetical protein
MTETDAKVDALLLEMFGSDPAGAVLSQDKIITKTPFSLDAPPVVKNNIPTGTQAQEVLEDEPMPSPFITEPKTPLVNDEGDIDWSDESANLVDVFDIIQGAGFKFIAGATEDEKEKLFSFSEKDKARLAKFTKPIAQKHNIRVPSEVSLLTALAEIMARNTSVALDMRKDKKEKADKLKADVKAAALAESSKTIKLKVVKEDKDND